MLETGFLNLFDQYLTRRSWGQYFRYTKKNNNCIKYNICMTHGLRYNKKLHNF